MLYSEKNLSLLAGLIMWLCPQMGEAALAALTPRVNLRGQAVCWDYPFSVTLVMFLAWPV